jgi:hypothetical protein
MSSEKDTIWFDPPKYRILMYLTISKVPKVFNDWYDVADYIKQENGAGRSVTITKWEYV